MTDSDNFMGTLGGLFGTAIVASAGMGLINQMSSQNDNWSRNRANRKKAKRKRR